jgi:hypothetical protein
MRSRSTGVQQSFPEPRIGGRAGPGRVPCRNILTGFISGQLELFPNLEHTASENGHSVGAHMGLELKSRRTAEFWNPSGFRLGLARSHWHHDAHQAPRAAGRPGPSSLEPLHWQKDFKSGPLSDPGREGSVPPRLPAPSGRPGILPVPGATDGMPVRATGRATQPGSVRVRVLHWQLTVALGRGIRILRVPGPAGGGGRLGPRHWDSGAGVQSARSSCRTRSGPVLRHRDDPAGGAGRGAAAVPVRRARADALAFKPRTPSRRPGRACKRSPEA